MSRAQRSQSHADNPDVPQVRVVRIADAIRPDPRNANRHTIRGREVLDHSIEQFGAGRSVLITADGVLIAGEATTEAAVEHGIEEVVIVPTDGRRLVAVQRTDIQSGDDRAILLGIADNRAAELGIQWDPDTLRTLIREVPDAADTFTAAELRSLLRDAVAGESEEPLELPPEYPLAIVLTEEEYQRWVEYKQRIGLRDDTRAFIRLLNEAASGGD